MKVDKKKLVKGMKELKGQADKAVNKALVKGAKVAAEVAAEANQVLATVPGRIQQAQTAATTVIGKATGYLAEHQDEIARTVVSAATGMAAVVLSGINRGAIGAAALAGAAGGFISTRLQKKE